MQEALGPSWMDNFESFDRLPFAAASIGQVHSAVLKAAVSPTGAPARVAVKVQFPNIVNSINSDLGYVKMLLTAGKLLPRGLFLDRTIQVMKDELKDECDYTREAAFARRFGRQDHLGGDPRFKVPWVWEKSTERVLVMEHVEGVSVGGSVINRLSQRDRDDVSGNRAVTRSVGVDHRYDTDRRACHRPLLARVVRVQGNADRPELDELPLEHAYPQGELFKISYGGGSGAKLLRTARLSLWTLARRASTQRSSSTTGYAFCPPLLQKTATRASSGA